MNEFKPRKPKSAQLEVKWSETESFTLITQQAVDGDSIARETSQRDADQLASAELQSQLL